jgi:hypothetical protein
MYRCSRCGSERRHDRRGTRPGSRARRRTLLRRADRLGAAACLALLVASPASSAAADESLSAGAAAWLASLDDAQRDDALYDFDDEERFDLRLAPFRLEGLRGDRLADAQWRALLDVLGAALSPEGLRKVETIMSLEREVRELDRNGGLLRWPAHFFRDARRYYLALFGKPAPDAPWGLRFDGHHVSLNWTVVPDSSPSVTPLFLGSQPREVPAGMERAGLRALPEEEDRSLALWRSLDAAQRTRASLPFEPTTGAFGGDRELLIGAGQRVDPAAPAGLPRGEMTPPQQALLDALIEVYVGNFAPEIAAARRQRIQAGEDRIHFAWAGGEEPGEPGYHRVQGPSFLIEFDNSVVDADHVHTVWREFAGDFGRDLLAEHHAHAHPTGPESLVSSEHASQ